MKQDEIKRERQRERARELNKRRKFAGGKICKNAMGEINE